MRRLAAPLVTTLALTLAAACNAGDDPTIGGPGAGGGATAGGARATTVPGPAVRTVEVTFADGAVAGGTGNQMVARGETLRLVVTADVAGEVHVHTYDEYLQVVPGEPAELSFVADIPGRHDVELHGPGDLLLTLEVTA